MILYGSTHGEGLKTLVEGTADVAMAARELSAQEHKAAEQKGFKLVNERICYDAVAIIVNKENTVDALSLDQLRKVFAGLSTNWNTLGGADESIVVVTLPPESGMASFLSKDVLNTPFAANAIEARAPREVIPQVRSRKGSISFCRTDLALSESKAKGIKTLVIKKDEASPAISLSEETVAKGTYPIIRPLGLCYDPAKAPAIAKEFVQWCIKKYKQTAQQ